MHYKFKEITIDRENPFQDDRLGRKICTDFDEYDC